jgi:flavorubredoxin
MEIVPSVYYVGVDDKRTELFESLWPIPNGISYNSYLVKGEDKVALIDTVKEEFFDDYLPSIRNIVDPKDLDYIILNHLEPDHAGSLSRVLSVAPNAHVVSTKNGIEFAKKYHRVTFDSISVKEGAKIDLGGKTLQFIDTPCIHWPETMSTYLPEDRILFSADIFGSFGVINENIYDTALDRSFIDEFKQYYAAILSPYAPFILKAVNRFRSIDPPVKLVAPSHGVLYRENISKIEEIYSSMSRGILHEKVVVVYGSMYGNTEVLAETIAKGVRNNGVESVIFNVAKSNMSEILMEICQSPVIAVGAPVYDSYVFPPITYLFEMIKLKRIKKRTFGIFGNYTWGGGSFKQIQNIINDLGSKVMGETVKAQGLPTDTDLQKAETLGKTLAETARTEVNHNN